MPQHCPPHQTQRTCSKRNLHPSSGTFPARNKLYWVTSMPEPKTTTHSLLMISTYARVQYTEFSTESSAGSCFVLSNSFFQNHAARIVLRKPRHASATSLLRTLHWLPVKARVRIQYKIACLCFQCLSHNTMPPYLSDLHTNHLERCALLTHLCFQFLASVWRPLAEDLSLFLASVPGIPYLYLSEKLSVFQLSKRI